MVDAARADEGGVEGFGGVGCHYEDVALERVLVRVFMLQWGFFFVFAVL